MTFYICTVSRVLYNVRQYCQVLYPYPSSLAPITPEVIGDPGNVPDRWRYCLGRCSGPYAGTLSVKVPDFQGRTLIDWVLLMVNNLFRDVIPTMFVPSLRVLHRDRVSGLPEQVVQRTLFRVERLVHAVLVVLVCAEPRLDVGKGELDRVKTW